MREELEGHVKDALMIASLSAGRTVAQLLSRVNGANLKELLIAALSVAREQTRQIAELECAIRDGEQERGWLEDEGLREPLRIQKSLRSRAP